MTDIPGRSISDHWDEAYARGDAQKSWTVAGPTRSLGTLLRAGLTVGQSVVDVGGGSSQLAGELLRAGVADITVIDLSERALDLARGRLGSRATQVEWITGDLLAWVPARTYDFWHDRAMLHFLVQEDQRGAYRNVLRAALAPGGVAVIATFAEDGPDRCSGLDVRRSSPEDVLAILGPGFDLVRDERASHRTPRGDAQMFTCVTARRTS